MLECPDLDLESRTLALRLLLRGSKDGERRIDGFFAGGGTGRVARAEMLKCAVGGRRYRGVLEFREILERELENKNTR